MNKKSILLVDDEPFILDALEFTINYTLNDNVSIDKVNNGEDAINLIKKNKYDLVICDHNIPKKKGGEVFLYIQHNKLNIPFVLFSGSAPHEFPQYYSQHKVYRYLEKPHFSDELNQILNELKNNNTDAETNSSLKHGQEENTMETGANFSDYVPISTDLLYNLGIVPSEIYLKLSAEKFLKIFIKHSALTQDDYDKSKKKNINYYYIQSHDANAIISQLEKNLQSIWHTMDSGKNNSHKEIADNRLAANKLIWEAVRNLGINEQVSALAKKNIEMSIKTIKSSKGLGDLLDKLFSLGEYPVKFYTLSGHIACAIAKECQWNNEVTLYKIIMAVFLQDITIKNPAFIEYENVMEAEKERFKYERTEWDNYLNHPFDAAKLVDSFQEIPPNIDRLILEHEELPQGKGFPKKLSELTISPLSAIIVISNLLAHQILKVNSKINIEEFLKEKNKELNFESGHYRKIFQAACKINIF